MEQLYVSSISCIFLSSSRIATLETLSFADPISTPSEMHQRCAAHNWNHDGTQWTCLAICANSRSSFRYLMPLFWRLVAYTPSISSSWLHNPSRQPDAHTVQTWRSLIPPRRPCTPPQHSAPGPRGRCCYWRCYCFCQQVTRAANWNLNAQTRIETQFTQVMRREDVPELSNHLRVSSEDFSNHGVTYHAKWCLALQISLVYIPALLSQVARDCYADFAGVVRVDEVQLSTYLHKGNVLW